MRPYAFLFDTVTVDAWYWNGVNSFEGNMLKSAFPDFDPVNNRPTQDDFVDFGGVSNTDVYHFVSTNDLTCTAAQAQFLEDSIPTFVEKKEYGCYSSHEWFSSRGLGQKQFIDDLVDALSQDSVYHVTPSNEIMTEAGATTLLFSTLATITASALLM